MKYLLKKLVNFNGNDVGLSTLECDYNNRIIYLTGEIDDELATLTGSALRSLDRDNNNDIILYINSPGGSVSAGFSILDTCHLLSSEVVTCATGMAASMGAFLLACAATPGKRFCHPNAQVLIHQPLGGTCGQAMDIKIHTNYILKTRERLNSMLAEATGQSVERIEADTDRDYILDAIQAKEYGLVDHVGDPLSNKEV